MVNYQSLIGLPWEYGVNDCFSLVRSYYQLAGIVLPDFKRPEDPDNSPSIFLEQAGGLGFYEICMDDARAGDVLIMRLGTPYPMHAAIYVGDQRILHQRRDSLSCVAALTRYYYKSIAAVYRYAANR